MSMKTIKAFFSHRSVQITFVLWAISNIFVLLMAHGHLPFNRPAFDGKSADLQLLLGNAALIEVFLLMVVVRFITKNRKVPDIASRAPERKQAIKEILCFITYGVIVQAVGIMLGKALGWHPISFHLAGTLYGAGDMVVTQAETFGWMVYNFVFFAVLPYLYFRYKKQYSNEKLSLHSNNLSNDMVVIVIILALESMFEAVGLGLGIAKLSTHQIAVGAPLTFMLYFLGTVLPTMIFIYSILLPRYHRLTQSTIATTILGGVTYTLVHFFDAWTVYSSPYNGALSLVFLFLLYFGPGMFKSFLTLRTANAWVHVWAYHAIAPHTLDDTPLVVKIFSIK